MSVTANRTLSLKLRSAETSDKETPFTLLHLTIKMIVESTIERGLSEMHSKVFHTSNDNVNISK